MAKRKISSGQKLLGIEGYILLVQNADHARRGRVAMFWSLISLLFVFGFFAVVPSKTVGVLGFSIRDLTDQKVLIALLCITSYYALRFGFSVAKIFILSNPRAVWREFFKYRKLKKSGFNFESEESGSRIHAWAEVGSWADGENAGDRSPNLNEPFRNSFPDGPYDILKKPNEVRYLNVRNSIFGFLENVFALMLLPAFLCIAAFLALVWKLLTLP